MARVTGVGGIFFKSKADSAALAAWYQKHLGMPMEDFGGAILKWPDDKAEDRGLTVWHVAERDSQWFSPSNASFMVNYRVDDLGELLAQLRAGGVEVIGGPECTRTANSRGSWIPTGTRSSSGSRSFGTRRTRAPEVPSHAACYSMQRTTLRDADDAER